MKAIIKRLLIIICVFLLVVSSITTAFAHSGNTDSSGGHKDNKNKSGLGSYHYHCGGYPAHLHPSGYCPYRDVFPSSVTITADKTVLGIGEKGYITSSVYPGNSCNTNLSWSCSDTSVISLSDGVITAINYGTATITAETFNGKKGTLTITVKEITADKVTVSGLPDAPNYYIGEKFNLKATITPENVDNPSIAWTSSNEEVASVSASGSVKLKASGSAEIKATASNGVSGKVVINVKEKYVETVEIVETEMDIYLGETPTIKAEVIPNDASFPSLTWTVDDPSILLVSESGQIDTLACGETTITATSSNGKSDSILVRVTEMKAVSVQIEGAKSFLIGDTISLSAKFNPLNTSDKNVTWSVDNTDIATISKDGVLTAKKLGTVTVMVTQKDVSSTCTIEILPIKVEEIQITASIEDDISKGDTISFYAEVFPESATYPDVTWSVSDPKIATIDDSGVLTVLKNGTVTVIATAGDGFSSEYEITSSSSFAAGAIGAVCVVGGAALFIKKRKNKNKNLNEKKARNSNSEELPQDAKTQIPPLDSKKQDGKSVNEYYYSAGHIDPTYVVVRCENCNAPNRIVKGSISRCEYCGTPVGNHDNNALSLDKEEAAISQAFAVIQRLIESIDEESISVTDGLDRYSHALETFPNRAMPLDVEMNNLSDKIRNFSFEAKRISAGIKAQIMIVCNNLMDYNDQSWEKVEAEIEKFSEIRDSLSETMSVLRSFKHSVETLSYNTPKIKAAKIRLADEFDSSLEFIQSAIKNYTDSLKLFRNAKFTSKTKRIKEQSNTDGYYNGM